VGDPINIGKIQGKSPGEMWGNTFEKLFSKRNRHSQALSIEKKKDRGDRYYLLRNKIGF